jgi:hypothetical protein
MSVKKGVIEAILKSILLPGCSEIRYAECNDQGIATITHKIILQICKRKPQHCDVLSSGHEAAGYR